MRSFKKLTPQERLVNAIEYSMQLVSGRLSAAGRDHALTLRGAHAQENQLLSRSVSIHARAGP
jgi:hypothetical protein